MEGSVRQRMAELRAAFARDMESQQSKLDSDVTSFRKSLQSITSKSERTVDNQVKLDKLKAQLRELEDHLVKALTVKTRKEAKRLAIVDSISVAKAKVEELSKVLTDQKERKERYAEILSQQLEALAETAEKIKQENAIGDDIADAIAWYNEVLGFRIEGGHGVKFTFTNINRKCPSEEYTFTVRHANNVYTLLDCNPQINDIKDLVHELNKSNDLFKFVRIIRAKFLESSTSGFAPTVTSTHEAAAMLSPATPLSMILPESRTQFSLPVRESNGDLKESGQKRSAKKAVLSSEFALSRRRSPRFINRTDDLSRF